LIILIGYQVFKHIAFAHFGYTADITDGIKLTSSVKMATPLEKA